MMHPTTTDTLEEQAVLAVRNAEIFAGSKLDDAIAKSYRVRTKRAYYETQINVAWCRIHYYDCVIAQMVFNPKYPTVRPIEERVAEVTMYREQCRESIPVLLRALSATPAHELLNPKENK